MAYTALKKRATRAVAMMHSMKVNARCPQRRIGCIPCPDSAEPEARGGCSRWFLATFIRLLVTSIPHANKSVKIPIPTRDFPSGARADRLELKPQPQGF